MSPARAAAAEGVGTAPLLAIVVGSGVMGEKLAGGNDAVALLANSIATGAGLYALIVVLGPISGAHFNPDRLRRQRLPSSIASAVGHRVRAGAVRRRFRRRRGCARHVRLAAPAGIHAPQTNPGRRRREFIATLGLVLVILLLSRFRREAIPAAVAAFVTSAYWFTSSTSFANLVVTLARSATDTFAGIAPSSGPLFIVSQLLGGAAAMLLAGWLLTGEHLEAPVERTGRSTRDSVSHRFATRADAAAVRNLLERSRLPVAGIDKHLESFLVARMAPTRSV